jgi:hypothetical protein
VSLLLVGGLLGVSTVSAVAPSATPTASDTPSSTPAGGGGGATASAPPPLDHLGLLPNPATVGVNGSQTYTARGFAANGFDLGDATATTAFVATLTATGLPDGTCTGSTCTGPFVTGDHTVTGTDGIGVTGTATLHVALVPDPVTNINAVAGDSQAVVTWSAPGSDGGSPITGYTVTASDGQSASVDGLTTTATVVGLTDGTPYTFTVTAANLVGASTAVTSVAPVTPQPNTPLGGTIAVVPITATGAVSLATTTFTDVTATGTTSVTLIDTSAPSAPPAPQAGYQISWSPLTSTSPVYYDIQTTARYDGSITVCLSYAGILPAPTDLLHYTGSPTPTWVPLVITSNDPGAQIICGTTTSLSPFAPATWTSPRLTVPSSVRATATGPSGAVVTYGATALDSAGSSLVPVCVPVSGTTFPVGVTRVACTATDGRQRASSASFTVTVGYGFAGFFQPVNDSLSSTSAMSVFKGGSTIPVKFSLTYAAGTLIPDTVAAACERARNVQRDRREKCRGDQRQPSIGEPSLADGTWARIR